MPTGGDILRDLERAMAVCEHAADQALAPWQRLVGRARLQPSEFAPRGSYYVLDLEAGGLAVGARVTRAIVAHPDTLIELRGRYPTAATDAELAAWLVWMADVHSLQLMDRS